MDDVVERLIGTVAAWRGSAGAADDAERDAAWGSKASGRGTLNGNAVGRGRGTTPYADVPGWCQAVSHAQIADHDWDLTPAHYVGTPTGGALPVGGSVGTARHPRAEILDRFESSAALDRRLRSLLEGTW